ncbi:MAG TPA: tRNA uridine-5-carboxymethylaminomethyl(34) synthesis enzyme MnmG [Sedimentibacter sp.]|jgi:tRNA uridine 5-carboxymethylaminomethyl modification enzyme|nr:tRNA uridine-5-carboxymethylaminomethyl(34) synthesis enzyme MnmG [Sedimentibacter sp.]HAS91760.1 tRNA uridine-5-carboxymethylaminomethyl(34) synthesis enzyme MnmG [Clostridiales bacterium]HOA19111.1 tRNA uridine-5-carboxymethylaminomethyl(34) synthesis enzyme MnmG [Sedimentibacter sp.]HOG62227.1 tRNA uridine-5-carboxymethylaminomethyl(34) synthesis enzyme MnmG [Sedimentibacter sp.]HPV85522.1 tRNA uridine-5-carboxymethylaminomethyl(34) synthesis enzyme MnmG [Sedimentibacter sp.]
MEDRVREFLEESIDVLVIGAGHAGCEASLATARLGLKTIMLTLSLDSIAMMPCNPNIGGTAKGHLVREIDALGGEMALNIDKTMIQCKMLNRSKGPAVHSLRAQADKKKYHREMKKVIENQKNLRVIQTEATKIKVNEDKSFNVYTKLGAYYRARAVIVTTGTYLKGRIYMGELNYSSGPDGLAPANELSDSLMDLGIELIKFKTGTPARIHKDSINYEKMTIQTGDDEIIPFSFMNDEINIEQVPCYITYTTQQTHELIRNNLDRSPLYGGVIKSVGPRYCPSLEDKVVKFSDKEKHQLFVEPEGLDTKEMYIQGMSTSLPYEVQIQMYRTMIGLENAEIMRPAYAIEYDAIDPTQLKPSLELISIKNLFFAGQINGSSGYEEAAAQGLIAGINAYLSLNNKEPFILDRSEAYIGVLIDDLVTKGTTEPYRMMTSRAEYRLLLRQDNADERLTEKGYKIGLVTEERYKRFKDKRQRIENEINRLKNLKITPKADTNKALEDMGSAALKIPTTLYDLLRRTELNYDNTLFLDPKRPVLRKEIKDYVETVIKYEGYIQKQIAQVEQFKKLENKKIPEDINYDDVKSLRIEARQKLNKIRPNSIGQASRISGVSPADINVLLIYLMTYNKE